MHKVLEKPIFNCLTVNNVVMIKMLKKDFSRSEEIKVLRTVDAVQQRQAPDLSRLKVQIKKSERKKVLKNIFENF